MNAWDQVASCHNWIINKIVIFFRSKISLLCTHLLTPSSPGVFQPCLWALKAHGYLVRQLPSLSSSLWHQYTVCISWTSQMLKLCLFVCCIVVCVSKSMECDIFPSVLWHCWLGDRKGIRPVKNSMLVCWWWWFDWNFARLMAPVVQLSPLTTSIILCFDKNRLIQVHLENGR